MGLVVMLIALMIVAIAITASPNPLNTCTVDRGPTPRKIEYLLKNKLKDEFVIKNSELDS